MALRIITLSLSDLFASLPIDQKINPQDSGIAFTGNVPGITNPPAYLDPSQVGAWHLGYLAAKAEAEGAEEIDTLQRHLANDYYQNGL